MSKVIYKDEHSTIQSLELDGREVYVTTIKTKRKWFELWKSKYSYYSYIASYNDYVVVGDREIDAFTNFDIGEDDRKFLENIFSEDKPDDPQN